jgi:hypothetical protein
MFPLVKVPTNNSLGSTKGIIERKKKRERNLEKKEFKLCLGMKNLYTLLKEQWDMLLICIQNNGFADRAPVLLP